VKPPEGRVHVGDRVVVPGGRRGLVTRERLIASNGACKYTVALADGETVEHLDYELKLLTDG
jgi:hypothetical protein